MFIPPRYYTLEKLVEVINSYVDEYDVKFMILNGGRVGVTYNIVWDYLYIQYLTTNNVTNSFSTTPFRIKLRHNFSNINISASIYPIIGNNWPIRSSCGRDDVKLTRVGAI